MRAVLATVLSTCLALTARAECDDVFLSDLDPAVGEVLSREVLSREATRVTEVEVIHRDVACHPAESDEECLARGAREQSGLPQGDQRLVVVIDGPFLGVRGLFIDGTEPLQQDFDSYEDAASWMEAELAQGRALALIQIGQRRDPAHRVALARAVEDRPEPFDAGPGLRLQLRLTVPFSTALHAFNAIDGLTVETWDSAADGTVTVELRCPPEA